MRINGSLDRCDAKVVEGWVRFLDEPARKARLKIFAGQHLLGTCAADLRRPDLVRTRQGDGCYAFSFPMPADLPETALAGIVVRVVGTDYLFRSGLNLVLHEPPAAEPAEGTGKRFRTCVLHIGTEKTGTTSLQTFFALNRGAFAEAGYFLPRSLAPDSEKGLFNHTHLAMYAMADQRFDDDPKRSSFGITDAAGLHAYRQRLEAALADEVAQLAATGDVMILSNEHCHSRLVTPIEIRSLKSLLDPYCRQYEVLVYLRPQYELAMSQYGMFVANGTWNIDMFPPLPPPPDYARETYTSIAYFDYDQLLRRWAAVFGEASIRPRLFIKGHLRNNDLIDDFMNDVPMRQQALLRPEQQNSNISEQAQRFLLEFYRHFGDDERQGASRVRERVRKVVRARFPGHGIRPTRAAVEEFMNRFRQGNESVRQRWFPRQAHLFDIDLTQFPLAESAHELTRAELVRMFAEILLADEAGTSAPPRG